MVGVFEPRAGVLAPERAVGAMLDQARRAGARLFMSEPVRAGPPRRGTSTCVRRAATCARGTSCSPPVRGWRRCWANCVLPLTVERVVQYLVSHCRRRRFSPSRFPIFLLEAPDGRMLYGLPDQGRGLKLAEHHGGPPPRVMASTRTVSAAERDGVPRVREPLAARPASWPRATRPSASTPTRRTATSSWTGIPPPPASSSAAPARATDSSSRRPSARRWPRSSPRARHRTIWDRSAWHASP